MNTTAMPNGRAKGRKKVLIVEDDRFLRDLAVKKLQLAGYVVVVAVDGNQALQQAAGEHPDLILLDIILPGVDGFEVLRRLKADGQLKHIPVVLLSNLGQKADLERGLSLGATDYLVKAHYTLDEIVDKLKTHLG